jgi:hypothetical protein
MTDIIEHPEAQLGTPMGGDVGVMSVITAHFAGYVACPFPGASLEGEIEGKPAVLKYTAARTQGRGQTRSTGTKLPCQEADCNAPGVPSALRHFGQGVRPLWKPLATLRILR